MLGLLLAVPLLVGVYFLLLRRKRKDALRYPDASLVREALGPRQRLRRHLPPLLLLLALMAAVGAITRPTAVVTLPTEQRTIILAIDVSLSMSANDVEPNRLAAAQEAAKAFVREQPPDVRIGVVSFAGTASVVQAPTSDREALLASLNRLQLDRHTAIGSGIILALATIFPDAGIDLEAAVFGGGISPERLRRGARGGAQADQPPVQSFVPVAPASYTSAAIILLTDGRRTTGPDPLEAAAMAADRGVRVFTVGFGTPEGATVNTEGLSIFMRFDEATLRGISTVTLGEYFHAGSAADLHRIYQSLNARMVLERKETELTALAAAAAAALALAAAFLSLLWFNRAG
jgi:Ca-activated chloride channel family protein